MNADERGCPMIMRPVGKTYSSDSGTGNDHSRDLRVPVFICGLKNKPAKRRLMTGA